MRDLSVLGVIGANDPGSTRLVYAMVIGLALIGMLLVALGVWLIRQTRVDPPLLGPLERMGERDWSKRDAPTQRRMLDEVRPEGAVPLRPEPAPPALDEEFAAARPASSLGDLGPGLGMSDADEEPANSPADRPWSPPLPAPDPAADEQPTDDVAADELPAPEKSV